ncbi:hypothetical protein NZNM25_08680 [Nitrosopumilus zosterae]|uniref:Roadblock/LC7 domain-containing protein n=2 Tax=Nitrosopumilus zosterae TaxID=718286 RepID=A0A2S2KR89_9ARCH|nr:hypothetical protein NZNM25_08680 [Nitrosopumilus zosterae]
MTCDITNVDFQNICKSISALEHDIYFVGLINDNGRLVEYVKKQNILIDDLEKDGLIMLCMQTRLYASMQSDHNKHFGRFGYSIIEREKTTLLTIPTVYGTVLVITSNQVDSKTLAKQISQVAYRDCFAKILN